MLGGFMDELLACWGKGAQSDASWEYYSSFLRPASSLAVLSPGTVGPWTWVVLGTDAKALNLEP